MKYLCKAFLLALFVGASCYAQTVSPTPMPPGQDAGSSELRNSAPDPPVILSKPLFESSELNRHLIIRARVSKIKEFAPLGFQIEIYLREKILGEPEDEDESLVFLIDGQSFPVSKRLSDKTVNLNNLTEDPLIYTQTFVFNIPAEKLELLRQARSISVMWKKGNIEVSSEGLNVLSDFILRNR